MFVVDYSVGLEGSFKFPGGPDGAGFNDAENLFSDRGLLSWRRAVPTSIRIFAVVKEEECHFGRLIFVHPSGLFLSNPNLKFHKSIWRLCGSANMIYP